MHGESVTGNYAVCIKPRTDVKFEDFYKTCEKLDRQTLFKEYTLVFEQNGLDMTELGKGFHVHIITTDVNSRSAPDIKRKVLSCFNKHCGDAGVKVQHLQTSKDLEQTLGYILERKSKDGHKLALTPFDMAWRAQWGLEPSYEKGGLPRLTAPKTPMESPSLLLALN